MKRWIVAVALITTLLTAGCGSSDSDDNAAGACTSKSARVVTQNFITTSKFDVDCVTAKTGIPFYFVNNDDTTHTITTDATSPEVFDAELPQKNSTYSHTFTKPGTYKITCKRHNETMTLLVS